MGTTHLQEMLDTDRSGPMSLHAVLVELLGHLGNGATGSAKPGCRPIFEDPQATRGFLHRLDVPSSGPELLGTMSIMSVVGLILAASSYAAYYDLRIQLANGRQALNDIHTVHWYTQNNLKCKTDEETGPKARFYGNIWRYAMATRATSTAQPLSTGLVALAHRADVDVGGPAGARATSCSGAISKPGAPATSTCALRRAGGIRFGRTSPLWAIPSTRMPGIAAAPPELKIRGSAGRTCCIDSRPRWPALARRGHRLRFNVHGRPCDATTPPPADTRLATCGSEVGQDMAELLVRLR